MNAIAPIDTAPAAIQIYGRIDFTTETTTSHTAILASATWDGDRLDLGSTRAAESIPHLATALVATSRIVALDVLEHVVDEEAWIACFAHLLAPGGSLTIRVPLEGPIAWFDALNVFRYVQDVTGLGKQPLETKMKGWHRHYRQTELEEMLERAGLVPVEVTRSGSPHHDIPHLGALAWGTIIRGDRATELRAGERRKRAEAGMDLPRLGPLSTKITVRAIKPRE
ncbi:MAG: class I SAM-dependent methyltransferase [Chloroflexota bacterium]|nr:class I SAM-dependent methyltransferase [Chloroflexota bacterium]